ncbi:EpsG family protein [Clostridium aceticum]|uniref:EpsG family protein n=1 Tax=Clostridium aceticum TaxID=84022 RepID=A0A0D8IAD8_9CLOT|nr:EpsG family protein [Clostridium aceticum]AKL93663.1 EpsG family protein [Clostridium aceticum]KJF27238.1 hypothetical protein TZ02_09255 [Clostridium aceticum]
MIWIIHFTIINILLYVSKRKKDDGFFIKSTFFYSIFVFGQRWMTGEDFPGYLLYYISGFTGKEIGYFALQNLFANKNLYFGLFIFLIYTITVFNNFKFIKRINKNTVFMIYLYMFLELYFMQMSQIRQFIAVSFFIHSYYFIFQRMYCRSLINLIIAISFHFSAVIIIPILFIRMKLSKKTMFYFVILCCALPLVNIKVLFNLGILNTYSHYIGSVYDTGLSFFHFIRYYAILFIILLYIYNIKIDVSSRIDRMILNGVLFYLVLYGLSFQFAPMMRVSYYLKIFEFIFIGYYIKDIKHFSPKLVKGTIVSMFLLFYLSIAIIDPYNITRYEFRPLQLRENRTDSELRMEIHNFYYD